MNHNFRSLSLSAKQNETPDSEHAVLVYFDLSDDEFGTEEDLNEIEELCDELDETLERTGAGELDGFEFGEGEGVIFMYGPNADSLYYRVEYTLKKSPLCQGGYIIKRYGDAGKEEKLWL